MQVFTVRAHAVGDGFMITSPNFPELSYLAASLDHCTAKSLIAEQCGIDADRAWLQIEVHTGRVDVVSSVHPQHLVSLHTFIPSEAAKSLENESMDPLLSAVLHHENRYAKDHGRDAPEVRFTLSFPAGRKIQRPRTGTFPLTAILVGDVSHLIDETEAGHSTVLARMQQHASSKTENPVLEVAELSTVQCVMIAPEQVPSTRFR